MFKKCLLLSLILMIFFTEYSVSQTIYGIVVSKENNAPIFEADVFLVNTNTGCATDKKGRFEIKDIPPGNYFLAVHHVGYENKYYQVKLYEGDKKEFRVELETRIIEGEKVQITAKKINWDKYYEIFERCFLGTTSNADKCFIRNPLVLDFEVSEDKSVLTASANEMLRIDNYSLGYHVDVILEEFEYSFDNKRKKYLMYPKFTDMKYQEKKRLELWENNRQDTYKGSLEHFLSTLIDESSLKEGFKVFESSGISSSLYSYDISDFYLTKADPILNTYKIIVDSRLRIIYPYYASNGLFSEIESNITDIVFTRNGYLINPLSVIVFGKWAEYGIADTLPRTYDYYKNK